jgi:hypothetical protein
MSEIFIYKEGIEKVSMAYPIDPIGTTRPTHSQELFDHIIEVVHKVPGGSKVHSEIVVGTSLYAGDLNRTRS